MSCLWTCKCLASISITAFNQAEFAPRSNPASPNYGKHMTAEAVIDFFAPTNDSVDAVRQWLVAAGVPAERISQSTNKQWMAFDVPVEQAERILHASYHIYEHTESGIRNIACQEYHVPQTVQDHIDYITPGIKLLNAGYTQKQTASPRKRSKRQTWEPDHIHVVTPDENSVEEWAELLSPGPCTTSVTTRCVRAQYHIPPGTRSTPGNELGIFQSLSQHYNQADLDAYFSTVTPWVPNGTHPTLRSINGAEGSTPNQAAAGEEADLDFEVAIPLVYPQKTVLFQTDDEWYQLDQQKATTQYAGFFNTLFDAIDGSYCTSEAFGEKGNCARDECRDPEYPNVHADSGYQGQLMCGVYRPTNVIAISYSGVEAALPYSYMQRQCLEIMKLGLQGVTVVESSGDHGVGGRRYDDRSGCLGPAKDIFSPRTMSNCPYVLSVGATTLVDNPTGSRCNKYKEVAPKTFASGGGFSNVFPTPVWQQRWVEGYLHRANMSHLGYIGGGHNFSHVGAEPGKLFNKAGRGYPDVAAVGEKYLVYMQGYPNHLAGTSVAVPIWASMLTLINEERLHAGKRTVGFVHQVLVSCTCC
jgi:tripeptidyl-peptidase-1